MFIFLHVLLIFGAVRQESGVQQVCVFTSSFFILLLDMFICRYLVCTFGAVLYKYICILSYILYITCGATAIGRGASACHSYTPLTRLLLASY
jgi:hypothetical protein